MKCSDCGRIMTPIKENPMAKKAKKEIIIDPILIDEDLLSAPSKESVQVIGPDTYLNDHMIPKNKILLGYHPITGAEVWSK